MSIIQKEIQRMTKKSWAKGRKEKCGNIQVSQETLEIARRMADESKMTIKDFIFTVLDRYASRSDNQVT